MTTHYLQSDTIRRLFSKGQPLTFGKGDVILGNTPSPNGVYYIVSGYIKIYSISNDGDESLHIIYGRNELFPLPWAYLGTQQGALFYEALSATVLWRISRYWFTHYVSNDLEISYALSTQLARQFRIYADRLDNLEYKKASERIAYGLLFLASRFGIKENGTVTIEAPLTHEIFANSINLARESVSREIERLKRQNIIKSNRYHNLVIKDVDALASKISSSVSLKDWEL